MKVIQTVRAYRETAALIARDQWRCFYESARPFNKQCDIKHIGSCLVDYPAPRSLDFLKVA
jgi:hypothetical protein